MQRTKRQHDHTIQDSNTNKKKKLRNEMPIINKTKSRFEDLANEIIYDLFDYLDYYHVYEGFFDLNNRFQNLLINSTLPLQINIPTMPKSSFERYYKNLILPNQHRINLLRLSNPFTVDLIFSPPRIISQFVRLETLILDNINAKKMSKIFDYLMCLPRLHSLTINPAEYLEFPSILFSEIFRLTRLKYCKISYRSKDDQDPFSLSLSEYDRSPIEYLIINSRFPFESFDSLLFCLPRLRHLSINCLVNSNDTSPRLCPIALSKYLKYVSIKLDSINFNRLENSIRTSFNRVEVLRISTIYDETYLDAKRWEELILTSMPNLRIFDINHAGSVRNNILTYHDLINQFNSSFWIDKQWVFTHQHDWQESLDSGIFYSTDPYRRKDFAFYWQSNEQVCPHVQVMDLNSVKHVHIFSKRATKNCANYFPNATELTIKHYFTTPDDSISTTLNRIIPLTQLTKLVIECFTFPFEQLVKLLYFTPNLHTLKLNRLSLDETNLKLLLPSESFQYVSKTNQIQNLELCDWCPLGKIQLIVSLFPRLKYLKAGMNRKEIDQIIRYLLQKTNKKSRHLLLLCISELPKICLKELNVLIKRENLLENYFIKFVNRDLYLWW